MLKIENYDLVFSTDGDAKEEVVLLVIEKEDIPSLSPPKKAIMRSDFLGNYSIDIYFQEKSSSDQPEKPLLSCINTPHELAEPMKKFSKIIVCSVDQNINSNQENPLSEDTNILEFEIPFSLEFK